MHDEVFVNTQENEQEVITDDFDDLDDDDFLDDDLEENIMNEISEPEIIVNDSQSDISDSIEIYPSIFKRISDIYQVEIEITESNVKTHFLKTIQHFDDLKNVKNEIASLEKILDLCHKLFPLNPDNSEKQFFEKHVIHLKKAVDKLNKKIERTIDPILAIDQFIENVLFEFIEHTFVDILLFHNNLPESKRKSEKELLTIKLDMLLLSGIEPIPVQEGTTKYCKQTHDIYEYRSDSQYADGIVIQNILEGYRLKRTKKILKKVGIVLNTRY